MWSRCRRTLENSHLLCLSVGDKVVKMPAWRKATWHRCGEAGRAVLVRCVYIIADSAGGLGGVGLLVAHGWWWWWLMDPKSTNPWTARSQSGKHHLAVIPNSCEVTTSRPFSSMEQELLTSPFSLGTPPPRRWDLHAYTVPHHRGCIRVRGACSILPYAYSASEVCMR